MKKIALPFILTLTLFFSAFSSKEPIDHSGEKQGIHFFEGTYKEALAKAKKENKLIFFDAYAVWCKPCLMMKKYSFTDPDVANYFNENFVNVMMDMEKGEGLTLSGQLDIAAYPTFFFIDGDGKIKSKKVGYMDGPALLSYGKSVKGAN